VFSILFIIIGLLIQGGFIYAASAFAGLEYADYWRSLTVAFVAWVIGLLGWAIIFVSPFLWAASLEGQVPRLIVSTTFAALTVWVATKIVMSTRWKLAGQVATWYFILTLIYRLFLVSLGVLQ